MEFNDKEKESKARSEAALQALHDENMRLGLYDYEVGFIEGKRSREWVGLTNEELCEIIGVSTSDSDWNVVKVQDWLRKVEAKLKEKNT